MPDISTPLHLHSRSFAEADARAVLSWRYPTPFDFYNPPESISEAEAADFLRPEFNHTVVSNEAGVMIAFQCFGVDAQVAGGDYEQDALDLGGGLHPAFCGRGLGRHVLAAAMNFAMGLFHPTRFRVTVADFNERALKVWRRSGFQVESSFERPADGVRFRVLLKDAAMMHLEIPFRVDVLGSRQTNPGS